MEDSSIALALNVSILVLVIISGIRVPDANERSSAQLYYFLAYTFLSSGYFSILPILAFPTSIVLVMTLFSSYFSKSHPYRLEISKSGMKFKERSPVNTNDDKKKRLAHFNRMRGIYDPVIYTNMVYLLFGLCSFFVFKQWELAVMQAFTFIGSTLYHLSKEANYFNLDQTFAGAMACIFMLSIYDAYNLDLNYFMISSFVGLPLGIFLFDYCGMPADVVYEPPSCCVRQGRLIYDQVHSLWHIISAIAPLGCAYFYSQQFPQEHLVLGRGYVDEGTMCLPKVPVYALVVSLLFNIFGNAVGFLPPK
jgi:hypothetical protein